MEANTESGSWRSKHVVRGQNGLYIGIDLGGTATKVGLVSGDGLVLAKAMIPTLELNTKEECDEFARKLQTFAHDALIDQGNDWSFDVSCVGLAIPGVINADEVIMLPNVTLNLKLLVASIEERFPWAKVNYLNDANAAALGEIWHGAAVGMNNLVMIMLGTGVGAGVVIDGRVLTGANGAAGEIGHFNVDADDDARDCGCGKSGCLEQYASGTGIVRSYIEERSKADPSFAASADASLITAIDVFRAYEVGDPYAKLAVKTFTETLGRAIAQMCALFDPEIVLLGGGVSNSADLFLPALRKAFARNCISPCANTRIEAAKLTQTAGIIGSVRYARDFA